VAEGATGKEEAQRGYGPKKKCFPNEQQERKHKKTEDNADLDEYGKRISGQQLTKNDLEENY
jgi:hypothetical protein